MKTIKMSTTRINHKQDYLLLGACLACTLFMLSIIWRIVVHCIRPTMGVFDLLTGPANTVFAEIETPLYCISWLIVLLSFAGYNFLNTFLNARLNSTTKQVMSGGMFVLSVIALIVLHSLYLISLIAGSSDPPATDIIVLALSYMVAVIAIITVCRHAQIKHSQVQMWSAGWVIKLFVAATVLLVIKSVWVQLPLLSLDCIQLYLKSALWLWTFDFSWIGSAVVFISIVVVMVLVVLEAKYPVHNRWLPLLVDISVTLGIFYAVFNMNFFTYDANFYIGPVYDVMHGKALLVNNQSQYGLLSIYGLSFFFTVFCIPLTYGNFFLVLTFLTIAGYISIYIVLLRGWLKSISISVMGIYMIVLWNYFGGHFYKLGSQLFPQVGFLRFGWWLPIILLLLIRTVFIQPGRRACLRKLFHLLEIVMVSMAFFWAFDTGIYVLGAYLATLFVEAFSQHSDIRKKTGYFVRQLIPLTVALVLLFISISIFTFMAMHQWPDWYGFMRDTIVYSMLGVMMLPMPATGIQVLFIGVYVLSAGYIIVKLFLAGGNMERDLPVLAFITAYGILQFLYYIGRSEAFRFHNVVIPLIIVICWFSLKVVRFILTREGTAYLKRHTVAIGVVSLITVMLVSMPVQMLTYDMARTIELRGDIIKLINERNNPDRWIPQNLPPRGFHDSVRAILEKEGGQNDVAIISYWDTYFLINTGKTNILDSNNLQGIMFNSQLDRLGSQMLSAKPFSVYVDSEDHGPYINVKYIMDKIVDFYYLERNYGYLDLYVLRSQSGNER